MLQSDQIRRLACEGDVCVPDCQLLCVSDHNVSDDKHFWRSCSVPKSLFNVTCMTDAVLNIACPCCFRCQPCPRFCGNVCSSRGAKRQKNQEESVHAFGWDYQGTCRSPVKPWVKGSFTMRIHLAFVHCQADWGLELDDLHLQPVKSVCCAGKVCSVCGCPLHIAGSRPEWWISSMIYSRVPTRMVNLEHDM